MFFHQNKKSFMTEPADWFNKQKWNIPDSFIAMYMSFRNWRPTVFMTLLSIPQQYCYWTCLWQQPQKHGVDTQTGLSLLVYLWKHGSITKHRVWPAPERRAAIYANNLETSHSVPNTGYIRGSGCHREWRGHSPRSLTVHYHLTQLMYLTIPMNCQPGEKLTPWMVLVCIPKCAYFWKHNRNNW